VTTTLVQLRRGKPTPGTTAPAAGARVVDGSQVGGPRVYVETHGCQMNVADSELLLGVLADAGYAAVTSPDDADVVVVNTCAVREKAEAKVLNRAHELGALQRRRPSW
jgi:hypothetical protein